MDGCHLAPSPSRPTTVGPLSSPRPSRSSSSTGAPIADAAGIAEGTIFRVFDSKDDLVAAALDQALDLEPFIVQLQEVDPDQPLGALLLEVVELFQHRFERVFTLMSRMGMIGPPKARRHMETERERVAAILQALAEPHRDFAARLAAAGVAALPVEANGGHDYAWWRGTVADALAWAFAPH